MLNRILGEIVSEGTKPYKSAFVSAAQNDPDHPKRVVTNAFIRRGCDVAVTENVTICSRHGMPSRPGWSPLTPLPFYEEEEE